MVFLRKAYNTILCRKMSSIDYYVQNRSFCHLYRLKCYLFGIVSLVLVHWDTIDDFIFPMVLHLILFLLNIRKCDFFLFLN